MTEQIFYSKIEDADDGSGDGILTIPPEILEFYGWKEGTKLDISVMENGSILIKEVRDVVEKQQP
jgi:bifunctional DNA-binding transcriptional regulator/antitoxin component of YhaV-PrlF toxin-antitoxin module